MAKSRTPQRLILKVPSSALKKRGWSMELPLAEAKREGYVVALGDSQMLRFIDELNGVEGVDDRIRTLKNRVKAIKKGGENTVKRRKIRTLYEEMDSLQFKGDYVCVVMESIADYRRACEGFTINGIRFTRLLGTNGGVKMHTIVFVSERLAPELRRRIANGRDMGKEFTPAKLESYQALTCSASIPLSWPKGIAVVDECITHFRSDAIHIRDGLDGEPEMEFEAGAEVELDESDGYGLMLPSLAHRWSEELELGYDTCGLNLRGSFLKGMVFSFDFLEFADEVAGTRVIRDAWGNDVDLSDVELVLTTSQLKLWDSYESMGDYIEKSKSNHYTLATTKACPERLDDTRTTNYQFLQSYDFSTVDMESLLKPTLDSIHSVLDGGVQEAIEFLGGPSEGEEYYVPDMPVAQALMAEPKMYDDPYVRKMLHSMLKRRIDDAKIGVLDVHGNFSILSGDPYSLCQHMFGMEVTGLLKAGEIYSKYWLDEGAKEVTSYRAPMSTHENIRRHRIAGAPEMEHWYCCMNACTILNSWDTTAAALNGADWQNSPPPWRRGGAHRVNMHMHGVA